MTTEVFEDVYYGQVRPEVLALVPDSARRMLELGCGYGKMAAALKARQECQVTGIEYVQRAAECAAEHLDRVIVADCEQVDFETAFGSVEFDCVIAADVLEHLRDPEAMLLRLLPYLTSDAVIVVSIP
ncbi:MAG: class I SAM-dependent methyltransferase, partial [Chloroflexi bacterium]|nr:class I SAM-dependent methyltransferase [Chloroflexota bacterium]